LFLFYIKIKHFEGHLYEEKIERLVSCKSVGVCFLRPFFSQYDRELSFACSIYFYYRFTFTQEESPEIHHFQLELLHPTGESETREREREKAQGRKKSATKGYDDRNENEMRFLS